MKLPEAGPTEGKDKNTTNNASTAQPNPQLSAVGQRVLNVLSPYGMSLDEISLVCIDAPQDISQSLVELQLAGFVRQGLGGYIRVS